MNVNQEIRRQIAEVADNKMSVWAFERWIEPISWSMHRDLSKPDIKLIGSIQSLFADFDYEGADESVLRRELLAMMPEQVFRIAILIADAPVEVEADDEPLSASQRWFPSAPVRIELLA